MRNPFRRGPKAEKGKREGEPHVIVGWPVPHGSGYAVVVEPLSAWRERPLPIGRSGEGSDTAFPIPNTYTLRKLSAFLRNHWRIKQTPDGRVVLEILGGKAPTKINGVVVAEKKARAEVEVKHGDVATTAGGMVHCVFDLEGKLHQKLRKPQAFLKHVERF